jgi:hypothetical protein
MVNELVFRRLKIYKVEKNIIAGRNGKAIYTM